MTTRLQITVPAAGVSDPIRVAGLKIIVEKTPDDTPDGVPTIHPETPGADPLPAFKQAAFAVPGGFNRLYVKGTAESAGETLYLLIINSIDVDVRIADTVE